MATHRIPIIGGQFLPDTSGDVFFEPYSNKATNDLYGHGVYIFNDTSTRIGWSGVFMVPQNYVGSPKIILPWTATAITGNVEWDFDYRAIAAGESMDPSTNQETVNIADVAPGTVHLLQIAELSLTAGNFAVGDMVPFGVFRDGTDAGDTMAAAAILFGAFFEYGDT